MIQIEREKLEKVLESLIDGDHWEKQEAITAIKEALAQHDSVQAKPEPEQEPATLEQIRKAMIFGTPLYTTPPQRKPLTKDRTMEIANQTAGQYWMDEAHIQRFRAAVEVDHGIQENT